MGTREREVQVMGGGPRFPVPKWVWTPAGGWWNYNPPNASRNFSLVLAGSAGLLLMVHRLSASNEVFHQMPTRSIPSERWNHSAALWAIRRRELEAAQE